MPAKKMKQRSNGRIFFAQEHRLGIERTFDAMRERQGLVYIMEVEC
jgi:hypothetical protein